MYYSTITFHLNDNDINNLNKSIDDIIDKVDFYPFIDIWEDENDLGKENKGDNNEKENS